MGLEVSAASELVQVCVTSIKSAAPTRVHEGSDDFYDSYARAALVEAIMSSDDASVAIPETKAKFDSEAYLPIETPATVDLRGVRTEWSIEAAA